VSLGLSGDTESQKNSPRTARHAPILAKSTQRFSIFAENRNEGWMYRGHEFPHKFETGGWVEVGFGSPAGG
jgi:hypothetical protein